MHTCYVYIDNSHRRLRVIRLPSEIFNKKN